MSTDDVEMRPAPASSAPVVDDDGYYALLGGDLSFYGPRSPSGSRQTSSLKATKPKKSSKTSQTSSPKLSGMSLSLSSKKLGILPSPANLRASPNTRLPSSTSRALGVGIVVAATRSMGIKSPTSTDFGLDGGDAMPRPKTSAGTVGTLGAFGSPVHAVPRAGSVGAVPMPRLEPDVRSLFDAKSLFGGSSTSSGSSGGSSGSSSFLGGYGRGGAGSMQVSSRKSLDRGSGWTGTLETIYSEDGSSVPAGMSTPVIIEPDHQREWEDELEKIVSSSKRRTAESGSVRSRRS
jgi:hypothetical protein